MSDVSLPDRFRPLLASGERLATHVAKPTMNPGDKYYPATIEQVAPELLREANDLAAYFRTLPNEWRDDRIYVEATVRPNFIAASYTPAALYAVLEARQVGTRIVTADYTTASRNKPDQVTKSLILSMPDSSLAKLQQLLASASNQEENLRHDFQKLLNLRPSMPEPVVGMDGDDEWVTYEAVLNPIPSGAGGVVASTDSVMAKFEAAIAGLEGELVRDYARAVGSLTFVPVRISPTRLSELYRFNPLRSIQPMPVLPEPSEFGLRATSSVQPPAVAAPSSDAFSVGIFDGGLGAAAGTIHFPDPDVELTGSHEVAKFTDHGIAVVGLSKYGVLDDGDVPPRPPLPVQSYRVFPPDSLPGDLHCYWMLDRIKEVVETGSHEIYNLSLGPALPVNEKALPDRWTAELDEIAWRQRVLFVVASGNDGEKAGRDRVQAPADGVNVLSVGACDAPEPAALRRASYSSRGPGRYGGRIQPRVVAFGGTPTDPLPLLKIDGSLRHDRGTSFAAPQVTHELSDLAASIADSNPDVLKAFAVHFAKRPVKRLTSELGFGRVPLALTSRLQCGPDEVHVLYRDRLARTADASYEIPCPSANALSLHVQVTLAFTSEVDPADAFEYSKSGITVRLRPDDQRFTWTRQGQSIEERLATPRALELENQGWKQSKHPVTKTPTEFKVKGQDEASLREEGKWETISAYTFNLEPGAYSHPKLYLSYFARESGSLVSNVPPIDFALLVTVTDRASGGIIYDQVRAEFSDLTAVIPVQTQLRT